MNRPYNPAFHAGMVDNCRRQAKDAGESTEHLTDKQVYDHYMDAYFCDDAESVFIELIHESQPKTV